MEKKIGTVSLTAMEAVELVVKYRNDIILGYDDGDSKEYWIGADSTTTLKMLSVFYDGVNYHFELVEFGKTNEELRKDYKFIQRMFTDLDVNHGLIDENTMLIEDAHTIVKWVMGKATFPPISACGCVNYFEM